MSRKPRVALYGGGGAPCHHAGVFGRAGYDVDFVFPVDIVNGALKGFDAFVMPGGGYRAMWGQLEPLGHDGARAVREYVQGGGMYLGSCAGSYSAATVPAGFVASCPVQKDLCLLEAGIWNDGDPDGLGLQSPGVGVIRSRNVRPDHPVMRGMPETFEIGHYNGPFFRGGEALATVVGATERFTPAEQFLSARTGPVLIDRASQETVPNIVVGSLGKGCVVLFGSHPEFGFTLAMNDEQAPARMLRNAVEWQVAESGRDELPSVSLLTHSEPSREGDLVNQVRGMAQRVRSRACELLEREGEPVWLRQEYAMSTYGLAPAVIWDSGLRAIVGFCDEIAERATSVDPRVLSFCPPSDWKVDGGYCGVLPLLAQSDQMLSQALQDWDIDLGAPVPNPYAYAETSPYHLVAGVYLSAIGRVTSAAILCEVYGAA